MRRFQFILICLVFVCSIIPLSCAGAKNSAWITEFAKKDADLGGLDEKSLHTVLKILNENNCACGCKEGNLASCLKHDATCGYSRTITREIVAQIKQGKSEEYLLGLLTGYFLHNKEKKAATQQDTNQVYTVKTDNSPWKGAADAPISIVEFTDFQCPFCIRAAATIEEVLRAYPNQVKIYFKNNPLPFHKQAYHAALASLAANEQGKHWEMREILFKNSRSLTKEKILRLAEEIGLNMEKFKNALENQALKDQIKADILQARGLGATGTPAFFINGRKLTGAQPFGTFKKVIDEELAKLKTKP